MENINKIELQGIVENSRINQVGDSSVVRFTLATNEVFSRRDGSLHEETTWHSVTAWSGKGMPDFSKIDKGTCVHVTGRLREIRYNDSDGNSKSFYEVLAAEVRIIN